MLRLSIRLVLRINQLLASVPFNPSVELKMLRLELASFSRLMVNFLPNNWLVMQHILCHFLFQKILSNRRISHGVIKKKKLNT
uniref:Uncharacterized protein n=1 Tax=Rhizophora mucronata TaxID=61149 RepID=A0A2P2QFR6_RHIMU